MTYLLFLGAFFRAAVLRAAGLRCVVFFAGALRVLYRVTVLPGPPPLPAVAAIATIPTSATAPSAPATMAPVLIPPFAVGATTIG